MVHSVLGWEATTLNDSQRAATWLAQQHEKLNAIDAAYRAIDATPVDHPHRPRRPNDHEQATADGDRYPQPHGPKTRLLPTEIDPTGTAVLRWETTCQQAATRIADAAAHIYGHATTASVRPRCHTVQPLPELPPVRITRAGYPQLNAHPKDLATYLASLHHWLAITIEAISGNIALEADDGEAAHIARRLTTLASQLGVRLCRCEDRCGLPAPERGRGATRPACRKRKQRRNNGRDGNDATLANQPRSRGRNGQEAHLGSTPSTSTSSRASASRGPRRPSSPEPAPAASS